MGNAYSNVNSEKSEIWWPPPVINRENLVEINQTRTTDKTDVAKTSESSLQDTCKVQKQQIQINESTPSSSKINTDENLEEDIQRKQRRENKLKEFRVDFEKKHLARREAIAERSREMLFLREELMKYKKENEQLKNLLKHSDDEDTAIENLEDIKYELRILKLENSELQRKISELKEDLNKSDELSKQNLDLRKSITETQKDLQAVNKQVLEFEKEKHDYENHVIALKDVIRVSKGLLEIRENQLRELKTKVADIQSSLAEREISMLSTNLKDEYERQLENIRSLRALYEQRQAATKAERDLMASQLTDAKNNLENEQKTNSEMQERINELEENVSGKYDEIKSLESQLGLSRAEYRGLEAEMSVINQLFSQILFDFNNCPDIDFDRLIKLLEENHDLLTNIVVNEESDAVSSALPKVLLDLVNQVADRNKNSETNSIISEEGFNSIAASSVSFNTLPEDSVQTDQQVNQMNSAEEIVNKLPKVWRILIELLRQQCGQQPVDIQDDDTDPCYKSIETPKGPKLVLSVSKTFIRLKDLILEKKSLEKEMSRLKQLNTHLEIRLQDQEKRLETVSAELSKTWHVVGRMQRQHQQLHTHEKVLRYELSQKRKMLTELKQELEYCREKWEQAREKNTSTEEEWKKLRTEFALRKATIADEFNNSGESGYSDEPECSSDEEAEKRSKILGENDHPSDTDETDLSNYSVNPEETKLNDNFNSETLSIITNQGSNFSHINQSECSDSIVKHKTDIEVQKLSIKTLPASLDMIDDVTPLAITPVAIETIPSKIDPFVDLPTTSKTLTELQETIEKVEQITNLSQQPITDIQSTINYEKENKPSSSSVEQPFTSCPDKLSDQDERLRRREERLKMLEEQCHQLVTKVINTNIRSIAMNDRLETLHEQYSNDNPRPNVQETEEDENQPEITEDEL